MPSSVNSPSILCVDDEANIRKYFAANLADEFQVQTAATADEAEAILARDADRFAIVITDQRMPGRTGSSLLASVRSKHPHIIRILTTAFSDIQGAIEAVNKGEVFRYITKPWDYDNLRMEMRIAMQVYELQRDREALLAEKLSVKMRMRAVERARLLIGLSGALTALPRFHEAVEAYIIDMATLNSSPSLPDAEQRPVAIDDAEEEAGFAAALAAKLASLSRNISSKTWSGIAESAEPVKWSSGSSSTATPLPPSAIVLARLLDEAAPHFFAVERPISATTNGPTAHLEITGAVRPDAQDQLLFGAAAAAAFQSRSALLKTYVLAFAVNGSAETALADDRLTISIAVPIDGMPMTSRPPQDPAVLNRRILQSLETWL